MFGCQTCHKILIFKTYIATDFVNNSLVDGSKTGYKKQFLDIGAQTGIKFLRVGTTHRSSVIYNPANKVSIRSIRVNITVGKCRIVNFNGADTAFL